MRLNPIVATLGTNALLYGAVFWYREGFRDDHARLARLGGGVWLGIPIPVYIAVRHGPGRGCGQAHARGTAFEVSARTPLRPGRRYRVQRHQTRPTFGLSSSTALRGLHAGIVNQPTSHEGDNYLLRPSQPWCSGTSLLGGRGNLAATAIAALFLSQLDQFVLALGVSYATRQLVQAALGGGRCALHRRLAGIRQRLSRRRPASVAPI